MANYKLFIPLFICFGLASIYASECRDIESDRRAQTRIISKDFDIRLHAGGGFTISSEQPLSPELMLEIARQVAAQLGSTKRTQNYGTLDGSDIHTPLIHNEETTPPQQECCLLWFIPKCLKRCLRRFCCC